MSQELHRSKSEVETSLDQRAYWSAHGHEYCETTISKNIDGFNKYPRAKTMQQLPQGHGSTGV
jgi:hypothetical protein